MTKLNARLESESIVRRYTAVALLTGALPVPAASAAIVAEQAVMFTHVAAIYGADVSFGTVLASMGGTATLNTAGRALFVEGMRWINATFAAGMATPLVSALGATTAGVQTWLLGQLAVAIAENGGNPLPEVAAKAVLERARVAFDAIDWTAETDVLGASAERSA